MMDERFIEREDPALMKVLFFRGEILPIDQIFLLFIGFYLRWIYRLTIKVF